MGMPMNLVGVELALDAPLRRRVAAQLVHELAPAPEPSASTFAHFAVQIRAGGEAIGECRITAQLLTREAYLRVRHRKDRSAAA